MVPHGLLNICFYQGLTQKVGLIGDTFRIYRQTPSNNMGFSNICDAQTSTKTKLPIPHLFLREHVLKLLT